MADSNQMQVDGDEGKGQHGEEYEEIREQVRQLQMCLACCTCHAISVLRECNQKNGSIPIIFLVDDLSRFYSSLFGKLMVFDFCYRTVIFLLPTLHALWRIHSLVRDDVWHFVLWWCLVWLSHTTCITENAKIAKDSKETVQVRHCGNNEMFFFLKIISRTRNLKEMYVSVPAYFDNRNVFRNSFPSSHRRRVINAFKRSARQSTETIFFGRWVHLGLTSMWSL